MAGFIAAAGFIPAVAIPQDAAPVAAPSGTDPAPVLKPYVPSQAASSTSSASRSSAPPRPRPKPAAPASTSASVSASSSSSSTATASSVQASPPAPPTASSSVTSVNRTASTPISAEDIETFTDAALRALMQRDHVLGATVAIVQGNNPILIKGYGYDRLSPVRRVDPETSLFRLGSVTKTFTWIVARQEIEAGRIQLDTPVSEWVPPEIFMENGPYKPLTLGSLMSHTAGFEDTSLGHLFQLGGRRLDGPGRHRPNRVREPGQFSTYSNFGVALAATALQQTAKAKDVPSLMEARIFRPLGMDHTTLREPYDPGLADLQNLPPPMAADLASRLSDGFIWDGASYRAQPFDHAIALSGALSGSTTARDMARLMTVMLAGGQGDGIALYNAESSAAFRTPMLKVPEGYNGWASGLMIRTAPAGVVTYGHTGSTLWFNSNLVIVPDLNLGIFISTNTQSGAALAETYPDLLLDHLNGVSARQPLMPAASQAYAANKRYYDSLKGQYVSTRRAYGGLEGFVTRLINTVQVDVDANGQLVLIGPGGISAYVPASAQGFFNAEDSEDSGLAGSTGGLHFVFAREGGKATVIETASNMMRYERVGWIHKPGTLNLLSVGMIATCILVWISLVRGLSRHERPTEEQARASLVSAGLSLAWLAAIFLFASWQSHVADDPGQLFTHWPSGQVQLASWLVVVASFGTAYQLATFYFVYNERQSFSSSDGWPIWQKVAHGLLLAYWVFYIITLGLWGALNPLA